MGQIKTPHCQVRHEGGGPCRQAIIASRGAPTFVHCSLARASIGSFTKYRTHFPLPSPGSCVTTLINKGQRPCTPKREPLVVCADAAEGDGRVAARV